MTGPQRGQIVLALGVFSWVMTCLGSCMGMGYIGPMVGFLTLWLAFSWRDQTDGERAPLIGGAVLAGSNVLVFVAFFGLLLLAFGGVVLAGSMGG